MTTETTLDLDDIFAAAESAVLNAHHCRAQVPKCHSCGKFFRMQPGVAWKMLYAGGAILEPHREIYRCLKCAGLLGEFTPQLGIVSSYSCGVVQ